MCNQYLSNFGLAVLFLILLYIISKLFFLTTLNSRLKNLTTDKEHFESNVRELQGYMNDVKNRVYNLEEFNLKNKGKK